jgi:glycosyltransferase involved in cell wall biosynthesis
MTQRFSAIHQFHSGAAPGDAITNQMFELQARLRKLGYQSEIYAEHIEDGINRSIRHLDRFVASPSELLLVHHSMGHRSFDVIHNLSNPIVTVYHNITPAQELDDPGYKHFSHVGRHQLDVLARRSLMGIAVSHYNRKEMLARGFARVEVMPVRTDYSEFLSVRETRRQERDWLFVGRIAPNKQQIEMVKAFDYFHHNFDKSANLFLLGDHKMTTYVAKLKETVETLGLKNHVTLPGKVEDVEVVNRYARAGVFVSLSRHEGFGVPLLEAMAAGVPVIALESSAVVETMGGAGVLLQSSDPMTVSHAVQRVMTDANYREEVIWRQDRRMERLTNFNTDEELLRVLGILNGDMQRPRIQVQGPIESSYSLAILNREAAFQLATDPALDVSVYPTEGPGDYRPNNEWIKSIEGLETLYERGLVTPYPDVIIRQMFPPRVKDTTAATTLQYFGWEESLVPAEFVRDFNSHVDRIMTMSTFVKDALIDSGVTVPIDVVGVGVRPPAIPASPRPVELMSLKGVRFLHISSAFPRKGVDVLLRAYFDEFTGADDVTLVLKTFPNQHNTVGQMIEELSTATTHPPHIIWIDRDMDPYELGHLYDIASAYVHPARGEGFGLPVAEAMLARVPVISTATSGLADFVNESTAAVVPSVPRPARTHVTVIGSTWFEPDVTVLRQEMRSMVTGADEGLRQSRLEAAHQLISRDFSWEAVGQRIHSAVEAARDGRTTIKVEHVTTFNSRCGIAEYSALLLEGLPKHIHSNVIADRDVWPIDYNKEENVVRLWQQLRHQDITPLATALTLSNSDIIHMQYNFGFFSMENLTELIDRIDGAKPIVVTLHRTKDLDRGHEIVSLAHAAEALRRVDTIIVHETHDIGRLADFGIVDNVVHIPHAAMPFKGVRSERVYTGEDPLRIGTFGFLLPHKGLETTLMSLHSLNYRGRPSTLKALCSLHPDPSSSATHHKVTDMITRWGMQDLVALDTAYKTVEQIHTELSDVDVLVLPYWETNESSSGVLAMLLGIGKPIIATDLDIFSGAKDAIRLIAAPPKEEELTAALDELMNRPDAMADLGRRARQRSIDISWGAIGNRTADLYKSLTQSRRS